MKLLQHMRFDSGNNLFLTSNTFFFFSCSAVFDVISNQHLYCPLQVLGDDDKRARYDRGEDIEETGMGGGGFNFGGGGQQFTFHFEGGFPGGFGGDGGFPGGFGFNF